MAYPSEYYTKAQEIIDKRRFENSVKAEKRLREVRSKIPEIVEIDSKLSKTIDELVKIILSDKPDKKQRNVTIPVTVTEEDARASMTL